MNPARGIELVLMPDGILETHAVARDGTQLFVFLSLSGLATEEDFMPLVIAIGDALVAFAVACTGSPPEMPLLAHSRKRGYISGRTRIIAPDVPQAEAWETWMLDALHRQYPEIPLHEFAMGSASEGLEALQARTIEAQESSDLPKLNALFEEGVIGPGERVVVTPEGEIVFGGPQ